MYNRYVPQSDGSYRRKPVEEPVHQPFCPRPEAPPLPPPSPPQRLPPAPPSPSPCQSCVHRPAVSRPQAPARQPESIGKFLKQLLPRGFDTEDLIVVLLLLLMAGENRETPNSPLLTLGLYLFL